MDRFEIEEVYGTAIISDQGLQKIEEFIAKDPKWIQRITAQFDPLGVEIFIKSLRHKKRKRISKD